MISRTLARRLKQLEEFVLPSDAPQQCVRIHSISPDGEVVDTHVVEIDLVRPVNVMARRSRLYGSLLSGALKASR